MSPVERQATSTGGGAGTITVKDSATTVTSVSTVYFTTGAVVSSGGAGIADVSISANIDGGSSTSNYLVSQVIDGGSA